MNKNQQIINQIINYIIEPNTNREDEFAEAIERLSDGKIKKDEFHDWVAKFDVKKLKSVAFV